MSNAKGILAALVMLALFGIVGELDLQAAEAEQARYCEMVKAGFWPDYQGTYRRECRTPTNGQR